MAFPIPQFMTELPVSSVFLKCPRVESHAWSCHFILTLIQHSTTPLIFMSPAYFWCENKAIFFLNIAIRHMTKTRMSLLDEEGAVVRKKERADERFTWMLMAKPLLGTAADTVLHSLVLWCCTVVEPKGLIEGSLASLQSQWVKVLCSLVLLSVWIFKL